MRLRLAMFSVWVGVLVVLAILPRALAQSSPVLELQLSPGITRLNITADAGSPLTLQSTTNIDSGPWLTWSNYTLLASPAQINNDPATNTRYYRAIIIVPTNMTWIPSGTFLMGSPTNELERNASETRHSVALSRGFFIGKFPVTQANYLSLMSTNPSYFNTNNGFLLDLNRPVERVSWSDATNFCSKLTQQERVAGRIFTNWVYRLPTEAEWEAACRAGSTNTFYYGTNLSSGMANFFGQYEYFNTIGTVFNSSGVYLARTTTVGSYQPNARGVYDMAGNVWEWCQDWFANFQTNSVVDPQGPATGTTRVFRGGAFNTIARECRSAARSSYFPSENANTIGFRVVLSSP